MTLPRLAADYFERNPAATMTLAAASGVLTSAPAIFQAANVVLAFIGALIGVGTGLFTFLIVLRKWKSGATI